MSILIKNGTVLTGESEVKADILIIDEKIAAVGQNIGQETDEVIDAEGKYVFPGGIDPVSYTHLDVYKRQA